MCNIQSWMERLAEELKNEFGSRLWFLGLQGSFGRGEGTAESDIDAVVILDRVGPEDLQRYSGLLDRLPYREKTCGFVCGRAELQNWEPSDLFSLCMDTVPLVGSLEELRSRISSSDIQRAVWTGVCTLYHLCAHNLIHERNGDILRGAVQIRRFHPSGDCLSANRALRKPDGTACRSLQPEERRILTFSQELREGKGSFRLRFPPLLRRPAFLGNQAGLHEEAGERDPNNSHRAGIRIPLGLSNKKGHFLPY